MKTSLAALLFLGLAAASLHAGGPANTTEEESEKIRADFDARVEYAKSQGRTGTFASSDIGMACEFYTVTHGSHGAPGYTLVIAAGLGRKDIVFSDSILVLCDRWSIDPKTGVLCSGRVMVSQHRIVAWGDKDMGVLLGDRGATFKIVNPSGSMDTGNPPADRKR